MYKIGNYDVDYATTAFATEGYADLWNIDNNHLFAGNGEAIREGRLEIAHHDTDNKKYLFEFCLTPNTGFLSNSDLLVKDVELKLSFDRSTPEQYLMCQDDTWAALGDFKVDIKNC